jgi:aspartate aminotransferase-like enzyme
MTRLLKVEGLIKNPVLSPTNKNQRLIEKVRRFTMIDWTKQAEEMAKSWAETQKKMWDNWLGVMQQEKGQATEVWEKTVGAWEETVKNTLNVQAEWTRMWADSLKSIEGAPKEVSEWAAQAQEMAKQWGEAQKQLWDNWFAMVKKVEPAKMSGDWSEEGQKMFKTWQESTQKMMEAQTEWVRRWAAQAEQKENQK